MSAPPCPAPAPCRVLSLRCALSQLLLQLSADPRAPVLFRCTAAAGGGADLGGGLGPAGLMPTLFLVKDALLQVGGGCGVGRAVRCLAHWHAAVAWPGSAAQFVC